MNWRIYILSFLALVLLSCKKDDPDPVEVNQKIKPADFLISETYQRLEVEILYILGHEPNDDALANMKVFLENRLHKPDGITLTKKGIDSPENFSYSADDIRALEQKHRTTYPVSNKLGAFIFYADAGYSKDTEDAQVLGIAYGPTSMAVFKSTVEENTGGIGQASELKLETTVLKHEFCHVLGLVNVGTSPVQDHEDGAHPGHCDNSNCLMYYATESASFSSLLFGESIPDLDVQCIEDLQANGGK